MTVIAMTRELGSRGLDIATALGKQLGLEVINDDVIERDIAQRTGLREDAVHRYFEGTASLLQRLRTDSKDLSDKAAEEVYELALKGNVILRGWGAPWLLRDIPHVLSVRVCAPMPDRMRVYIERGLALDRDAARREIERRDSANDAAMRKLFGADIADASTYAMALNSARVGVPKCVEMIADLAADPAYAKTEASERRLLDRLVLLRAQAALEKEFGSDRRFTTIGASVANGRVTLTGQSLYEQVNEAATAIVRGIPSVTDVDSRITVLPYYRRHAA